MDNFYTSPALLYELHKDFKIQSCGTVRTNSVGYQEEFKSLKPNDLGERGTSRTRVSGKLLVMAWKDKKVVHFLSMIHQPGGGTVCRRCNKDGNQVEIACPKLVSDYQKYMGGVDRADQHIQTYTCSHKSYKWLRQMFFQIIEMSCNNVFIYFHKIKNTKLRYLSFRDKLVKQQCSNSSVTRPRRSVTCLTDTCRLDVGSHFPC